MVTNRSQKLNIYYNNVRSITYKSTDLLTLGDFDIVCLTETHLDQSFQSEEFFDSNLFLVYRKDRNAFGDGILIAIRNEIPHTCLNLDIKLEVISVALRQKRKIEFTIITCLYRPPLVIVISIFLKN